MKKGLLSALGCSVVWGFFPLFWRVFDRTPPLYILASRIFWCTVFTGAVLLLTRRGPELREALRERRVWLPSVVAGLVISFNWWIYIAAVNAGRTLDATLGQFMNSLTCCLVSGLVFHERPNRMQWAAILLAGGSVLTMSILFGTIPWVALVMSSTFAVYSALKKTAPARGAVSLFLESAGLAPFCLLAILWMERAGVGALGNLDGWRLAMLPMLGAVTGVPLLLYSKSLRLLPMSLAGFLQYINSFISFVLALTVLGERFDPAMGVGYAMVWTSLVIYSLGSRRAAPQEEQQHAGEAL